MLGYPASVLAFKNLLDSSDKEMVLVVAVLGLLGLSEGSCDNWKGTDLEKDWLSLFSSILN